MNRRFSRALPLTLLGICVLSLATSSIAGESAADNILSPKDPVVGLKFTEIGSPNSLTEDGDYGGTSGREEPPAAATDGDPETKYFNKAQDGNHPPGIHSGFAVTPKAGPTIVTGVQFAAANDLLARDPIKITLEGSNDPDALAAGAKRYTLIYAGVTGLDPDPGRSTFGAVVTFRNSIPYKSYRILVTEARGGESADAVQYGEVKLIGIKSTGH